jgi:hypothetical protein
MNFEYMRRAIKTRKTLFQSVPWKGDVILALSFFREDRRNRMRERTPKSPEAPKEIKPASGFLSVPIPKRKDSIKTQMEKSSQKTLLP